MSVKATGYKKWQIDYRLPNGRRRRETVSGAKKLAETVLAKRRVEIAEGKFLDIERKEKIRFEDFAREFINLYSKPNKKSWKSDEYYLLSLNRFFKNKYLYTISVRDIDHFKSVRSQEVAPATVNRELSCLRNMFNRAVEWGKVSSNPAKSVKLLNEPKGRLRFLECEEIARLIENCADHLRPIVILAVNTGMRRGEILHMKWHDVDFKRDIITLLDTKNGEKRDVFMNAQVKMTLMSIPRHPESAYIFCHSDGKPLHDIRKSFFTALKKSGIKDFHFHDLRHTFCSQLAMSGVDINTIRELAGHKDVRMTLRYSHLSPSHKKHAIDQLGKKLDTFWTLDRISKKSEKANLSQTTENKTLK